MENRGRCRNKGSISRSSFTESFSYPCRSGEREGKTPRKRGGISYEWHKTLKLSSRNFIQTHDIPYGKTLHHQIVILTKVLCECLLGVIFPPDSFRKFRRWSRLLPWQQRTLLYSARILKIEAKRNHYFKKECEPEFVVRLVHFRGKKCHMIIAVVIATNAWTRFEPSN